MPPKHSKNLGRLLEELRAGDIDWREFQEAIRVQARHEGIKKMVYRIPFDRWQWAWAIGDTFFVDTYSLVDENNIEVDPRKIDDGSLRISVALVPKQLRFEREEFIQRLCQRAGRNIDKELEVAGLVERNSLR
jgi:hypothetical protein